jgi:hypothetical protein
VGSLNVLELSGPDAPATITSGLLSRSLWGIVPTAGSVEHVDATSAPVPVVTVRERVLMKRAYFVPLMRVRYPTIIPASLEVIGAL